MDSHADIVRMLRDGDLLALELIQQRFGADLRALALAILGSDSAADDALQDTYVSIARHRALVSEAVDLRGYLARMVRNQALTELRRRSRQREQPPPDLLMAIREVDRGAAIDVSTALMALPPEQREVMVLKIWRGHTFEQIGALVGISPNTAMSRYRYASEKLRVLLKGIDGR